MKRVLTSSIVGAMLAVAVQAHAITRCEVIEDAESWVAAGVPYSQGPYGTYCASDYCYSDPLRPGPTCWRSDCSGFVSATWNVSTASQYSGRSTLGYAPFDTSVSFVLGSIYDLLPGDALNNKDHIMLFGGWTGGDTFFIYQESTCYASAGTTVAHRRDFSVHDSYVKTFLPIRYVGIEPCDAPPEGWLDAVGCDKLSGWAYDVDDPAQAIDVHLYFGGPAGSGAPAVSVRAQVHRDDLCTAIGSCAHGFGLLPPLSLFDGQSHAVHAYGISVGGDNNAELSGSPKALSCPATLPDGVRRHVINPDSLTAWKLEAFQDQLPAAEADVVALGQGPDLPAVPTLAKSDDGSPEVWMVDGEFRRHIPNPDVMAAWRLDWASIQTLPASEMKALSVGPPWRARPVMVEAENALWVVDDPMVVPEVDAGGSDAAETSGDAHAPDATGDAGSSVGSDAGGLPHPEHADDDSSCSVSMPGIPLNGVRVWFVVALMVLSRRRKLAS